MDPLCVDAVRLKAETDTTAETYLGSVEYRRMDESKKPSILTVLGRAKTQMTIWNILHFLNVTTNSDVALSQLLLF